MAADTITGSEWHLNGKISQMLAGAWNCHHLLSAFGNGILSWDWENLLCVCGEKKNLCTICCFSSLLCQETDEGSDIALSVCLDSVMVNICNAQ